MRVLTALNLSFGWMFNRIDLPLSVSIDVTNKCNLNCSHCYFKNQKGKSEISKEKWMERIKQIRESYNIVHCTWIGGEPLLRRDVVEEGKRFFDFNWVVTNGTIEIPDWKRCSFFVSIDGTKEIHEDIRGKGTYEKSRQNILSSNSKIFLATVLNSKNYFCIEEMIKEWSNTNVRGINFDFYTPVKQDDELFIPLDKRNEVLDKLLELKKEYDDFILMSEKSIELMRSENYMNVVGENCVVRKTSVCLDSMGEVKTPCVMGKVDCSRCGCTIPYWMSATLGKDLKTSKMMAKLVI